MVNFKSSQCLFCPKISIINEGLCEMCKYYRYTKKRREKVLESKNIKKQVNKINMVYINF